MAENGSLRGKLQSGIEAARAGNRIQARRILEEVVAEDPHSELAFIWLATVVNNPSEKRRYLERVLEINPDNDRARTALQQLGGGARQANPQQSQRVEELREFDRRSTQTATQVQSSGGLGGGQFLLIGAVVIAIVAAVVIGPSLLNTTPQPTRVSAIPTVTASFTPDPSTATPTVDPFIVVSLPPTDLPPPTFTPTRTPTPFPSETPTNTPFPLNQFEALYLARNPIDTASTLYRMTGDGSGEQVLADNILDFAYSPDGRQIAFSRMVEYLPDEENPDATEVSEIFLASLDNLDSAQQLTTVRVANAHSPAFSPDGLQLVFVSDLGGDDNLWLHDINTGLSTQLTFYEGIDRDPHWSPDGTQLVFTSDRGSAGLTEIFRLTFVIRLEGAPEGEEAHDIERITDDRGSSFSPKWSNDMSQIVYLNDREGDSDIFVVDANGVNRRFVTVDDDGAEDRQANFTPDGRLVVFVSNRENDRFQAYLVDTQGRNLTPLITTEQEVQSVAYRPELIFRFVPEP